MQKIIQIYPCLLKLSCKQESVTDGQTAAITISPHRYRGGITITCPLIWFCEFHLWPNGSVVTRRMLNKRGISKPPPVFLSSFRFLFFTGIFSLSQISCANWFPLSIKLIERTLSLAIKLVLGKFSINLYAVSDCCIMMTCDQFLSFIVAT